MKVTTLVIHHSASKRNTSFESINLWHKERFNFLSSLLFYVGYHYVILEDGTVKQARRDDELGAHVANENSGKIGICLTGNFEEESPTEAQIKSLEALVERLKMTYGITDVRGHRDCLKSKTVCPGEELYKITLQWKVSWLQKLIALLLKGRK